MILRNIFENCTTHNKLAKATKLTLTILNKDFPLLHLQAER